ncbi:hypothetical protein GKE82_02665 [Conexibacter sp. W3-3-2]|uniref:Uncharacterized protein n=1 Tax=Paraconexibacter algicola TaxID=2133960 RepID=A0A2T4UCN2_9ACTN|nr:MULTISPECIES: hypothetical protein [Solirubrobacterales]MTD43235.1 hypothetical protein [Conexibacter sp. W3-3-2]PTL54980.1 hypothetical protein C7Y72_20635 [Paraconexibacter algicola]
MDDLDEALDAAIAAANPGRALQDLIRARLDLGDGPDELAAALAAHAWTLGEETPAARGLAAYADRLRAGWTPPPA